MKWYHIFYTPLVSEQPVNVNLAKELERFEDHGSKDFVAGRDSLSTIRDDVEQDIEESKTPKPSDQVEPVAPRSLFERVTSGLNKDVVTVKTKRVADVH
jgi:hypothetical protein